MTILPSNYGKILIILGCIISMIALALGGIYPNFRDGLDIDRRIRMNRKKIETQQLLLPIFRQLNDRIEKDEKRKEMLPSIVVPAKPKEIEKFLRLISEIAVENKLILKQINPDSDLYRNTNEQIGINISLTGDFFHFRQLLLQLCYIRFLHEIEFIRIQANGQNHTFNIRLILVQK